MGALWGHGPAPAPSGVCMCGQATTETDRSGRIEHHACTAQVLETVARESHPYEDAAGVADWLAEQRARVGAGWSR